jgi:hypothetical protein
MRKAAAGPVGVTSIGNLLHRLQASGYPIGRGELRARGA